MFCPECKAEYEDWVATCSDCNVALVAILPEENQENTPLPQLFTLAAFSNPLEAHLVKTKLESEGIPCFLGNENIIAMNWLYSNAVGGVKLQVLETDAERAKEILKETSAESPAGEKVPQESAGRKCPQCGSVKSRYEKFSRRFAFVSWLLLGLPLPFIKRKWKCETCGHEWK